MNLLRCFKALAVSLACPGLLVPVSPMAAAQPSSVGAPVSSALWDVRLDRDYALRGKLVDSSGRVLGDQPMVLAQAGKEIAVVRTDAGGVFAFRQVRGGVYQLIVDRAAVTCRVWTAQAAPPAAAEQLVLVAPTATVRGQQPFSAVFTNPLVIGLIVAAAVVVPIAVHNAHKDGS